MQRPVAVQLDVLDVYVADGLSRLDLFDLAPYVPRERDGVIVRVDEYELRAEALAAAGADGRGDWR